MSKSLEEKYKKALGQNIKQIRKRIKLTQDTFSEKIGIEPSSLSNIENGKSFPSTLTLIQIQQQFRVKIEEIFNIEPVNNNEIEKEIHYKLSELDDKKKIILFNILKLIE